jgi:hypothetical protein
VKRGIGLGLAEISIEERYWGLGLAEVRREAR